MNGPDPTELHPVPGFEQVCFIKNAISNPNVIIGDYTYYDDPDGATDFEKNILYHFPFIGDKLIIGKFCALAWGVKFIMNGANHIMSGTSTYPFYIFGDGWEPALSERAVFPNKGDTVIGHDVWIGYEALIMPGVKIGDGAIIASRAVVTADVPPFTVYGGNPAKLIRERFSREQVQRLQAVAWWDWPIEKLTPILPILVAGEVEEFLSQAEALN